jgi:eukaryotic-like serine/threonine-protein kinase
VTSAWEDRLGTVIIGVVVQGTASAAVVPTARRFGRYETIARIATGGMAEVYLARQTGPLNFSKLVVIKTIHPHLASEREMIDMLLDEARIAAQIKHPYIVDIYDLGEEAGTYFIAMEYLSGASLADVLVAGEQGARLPVHATAALIAECADALHAAHTWSGLDGRPLGVVHRDVTPGNIIVLYTGDVKLVDFGIAKARGRAVVTGTDHRIKGKIGYVAPEQLEGDEADARSDVFALGIVLWEALTYRRLFWAPTEAAVVRAIISGDVVPPSHWESEVPAQLDRICLRALAPRPGERYPTAQAMCDDLRGFLRGAGHHDHERVVAAYMARTFSERARQHEVMFQLASGSRGGPIPDLPVRRATTGGEAEPEIELFTQETASLHRDPAGGSYEPYDRGDRALDDFDELTDVTEAAPLPPLALTQGSLVTDEVTPLHRLRRRRVITAIVLGTLAVGAVGYAALRPADPPAAPTTIASGAPAERAAEAPAPPVVAEMPVAIDAAPVAQAPRAPARPAERPRKPVRAAVATSPPAPDEAERPDPGQPSGATTPQRLYNEGMRLQVAGDTNGAIARFKSALAADSDFAPAYRGLGLAYERQGRADRAARAFRTYLSKAGSASDAGAIRARLVRLDGARTP